MSMKVRYCPECASPLTKLDETAYLCANGHPYYNNPRCGCSVIFLNTQGEMLFSLRANEPNKGKYDFPGGFLDFGEDPYQAAKREVQEELDVAIDIADLELIDGELNHYLENDDVCDFVFICRKWEGQLQARDDVATYVWKPVEFLRSPEFAWPYPYLYSKLQHQGPANVQAS